MVGFIIGFFVGGTLGVLAMCISIASGQADKDIERNHV